MSKKIGSYKTNKGEKFHKVKSGGTTRSKVHKRTVPKNIDYYRKDVKTVKVSAHLPTSSNTIKQYNLPIQTIESVRSGFNFESFKHYYDSIELPTSKWAVIIGVGERTMQSILKEKRDLDQNKSEKLMAFLMLTEYAIEVLGDHTNMMEWLNYKSPALNGQTPLDYVDTFQGVMMLKEHLFKIETGNLA